jgi:hypothetical protein
LIVFFIYKTNKNYHSQTRCGVSQTCKVLNEHNLHFYTKSKSMTKEIKNTSKKMLCILLVSYMYASKTGDTTYGFRNGEYYEAIATDESDDEFEIDEENPTIEQPKINKDDKENEEITNENVSEKLTNFFADIK